MHHPCSPPWLGPTVEHHAPHPLHNAPPPHAPASNTASPDDLASQIAAELRAIATREVQSLSAASATRH